MLLAASKLLPIEKVLQPQHAIHHGPTFLGSKACAHMGYHVSVPILIKRHTHAPKNSVSNAFRVGSLVCSETITPTFMGHQMLLKSVI